MSIRVLKAIEYVLYPLVRLLIARGISFGSFSDAVKFAMVKEAERLIVSRGTAMPSDSRISIATGVHRKEVKRIRALKQQDEAGFEPSLTSQVIAKWAGDHSSCAANGAQRLSKKSSGENADSFEDLVTSISKDVRPKVVLDDLIDRGIVSLDSEGFVNLHMENFGMKISEEETLDYLSLNIHDHLSSAVNNLTHPNDKFLDRCVHYHGFSEEAISKLRKLAEFHAMQALMAVNEEAQRLSQDPACKGVNRMNFGSYFYQEKSEQK